MSDIDWLVARPVAHRGLHAGKRIIENTPSAFVAAIAGCYGIECDLQITADGEALVHHDDALGRLTDGNARLDAMTAAELKRISTRSSSDRMITLGELCDLVSGRSNDLRCEQVVAAADSGVGRAQHDRARKGQAARRPDDL